MDRFNWTEDKTRVERDTFRQSDRFWRTRRVVYAIYRNVINAGFNSVFFGIACTTNDAVNSPILRFNRSSKTRLPLGTAYKRLSTLWLRTPRRRRVCSRVRPRGQIRYSLY